jgi:hypothetical protein
MLKIRNFSLVRLYMVRCLKAMRVNSKIKPTQIARLVIRYTTNYFFNVTLCRAQFLSIFAGYDNNLTISWHAKEFILLVSLCLAILSSMFRCKSSVTIVSFERALIGLWQNNTMYILQHKTKLMTARKQGYRVKHPNWHPCESFWNVLRFGS